MIKIHAEDQPYQCILWRKSPDEPIKTFQLCTVTYGVTSAPDLALRCLKQLPLSQRHADTRDQHICRRHNHRSGHNYKSYRS